MGVIAKIVEIIAPESAATGELILIGGRAHNEGDTGDIYIRFIDRDTGEMIPIAVSPNVEYCSSPGAAGQKAMPPKSWNLRMEVGEGWPTNPINITDTRDITILNPEYPLEYVVTIDSGPVKGVPVTIDGVLVGSTPTVRNSQLGVHVIGVPKEVEG
jgi:hypothetical protein